MVFSGHVCVDPKGFFLVLCFLYLTKGNSKSFKITPGKQPLSSCVSSPINCLDPLF